MINTMNTRGAHKAWLKISAAVIASFAPIVALATFEATAEPARLVFDLIDWPLDGGGDLSARETRFLAAIAGGLLLGWGVMIWMLSDRVYDAAPEAVRRAVVTSLLAWYALDGLGSVAAGVPGNILGNSLILLIAVGPMWLPPRTAPADRGGAA